MIPVFVVVLVARLSYTKAKRDMPVVMEAYAPERVELETSSMETRGPSQLRADVDPRSQLQDKHDSVASGEVLEEEHEQHKAQGPHYSATKPHSAACDGCVCKLRGEK